MYITLKLFEFWKNFNNFSKENFQEGDEIPTSEYIQYT